MTLKKFGALFVLMIAISGVLSLTGCSEKIPESKGVEAPGGAKPVMQGATSAGGGGDTATKK